MIPLIKIRTQTDSVKHSLSKRGWSQERTRIIDEIIALDDQRKTIQLQLDSNLAESKQLSSRIGELMKKGAAQEANEFKERIAELKESIKSLEEIFKNCKNDLTEKLLQVPNALHDSVPFGKGAEDNEVYKDWQKEFPEIGENPLPHWDLAKKYNIIDFERGAFITGSGFPLFQGKGARLNRALINFFLDEAIDNGYLEIRPPFLVNEDSARATGQLPDKDGQMYFVQEDNFYLIPTGEVPITNIYRDVILKETDFPIRMVGMTPCFRREAGSYGSDVKGLNRVHQFDKVEIVHIEHPDRSYETLHKMLDHVENLLIKLELPYRILRLCGGDLGFTSALTFDFEVYAAAQKKWLEVSSVSNFEDFQANRLMLRYKDDSGKTNLAHTLNGSALALARIVAAVLENNQCESGIKVPEVLQKYTGFEMID